MQGEKSINNTVSGSTCIWWQVRDRKERKGMKKERGSDYVGSSTGMNSDVERQRSEYDRTSMRRKGCGSSRRNSLKFLLPCPSFPEGRGQLDPNHCVYCEKEGHWKRDCPVQPQMTRGFGNPPVWKPPSRENAEELAEFPQYDVQQWQEVEEPGRLAACKLVVDHAQIMIKVNNHTLEFLIDMGATYSMINQYSGELSQEKI